MDGRDPNEGSTDPMVEEYWLLGEAVQDRILSLGYRQEEVDGIAVDIHDILQAADLVKSEIAPAILGAGSPEELAAAIERLKFELCHLEWHGRSGQRYLESVQAQLAEQS